MVKEEYTHKGQTVTTHFAKTGTPVASSQNVSTSYTPTSTLSKEEHMESHSSRRRSNRELRDDTFEDPGVVDDYESAPAYGKGEKRPKTRGCSPLTCPTGAAPTGRPQKKSGGGVGSIFAGMGANIIDVLQKVPEPAWIRDGGGKGGKKGRGIPGMGPGNVPDWVMTGRAPWDGPVKKQQGAPVVKTVITKVHADGSKTRSVRGGTPTQHKAPKKPNWINW